MIQDFLSNMYYNNTGKEYLLAVLIFIGVLVVLKIFKTIVVARLKKFAERSKTDFDDTIIEIVSNLKPPFYFLIALYLGVRSLVLPDLIGKIISVLFLLSIVYEVISALQKIIEYVAYKAMLRSGKDDEEANKSAIRTLSVVIKIILWSFGLILILGNLGVDITSLIAGLGIGGIAVALALQNVLGDVFASFSIIIDKPFQVGDFIKIGEDIGEVEKIGIKTTRIRTPDGQQLIVSNKELTEARVQNFKRLEKRRALFSLGVIYETDKEKLEKIPRLVEAIVMQNKIAEFDRCHFKSFGDFSLNFEVAFYVNSQDYIEYLDAVQEINLKIFEIFNKEGIEFAYPTSVEYQKKV
jgi:small-conductance mechanosensitive channel